MAGIIQKIGEKLHGDKHKEEEKPKHGEADHKHQEGEHKEGFADKFKEKLHPGEQQHDGEKKKKKDKKDKKKHEHGHGHGGDSSSSDSD